MTPDDLLGPEVSRTMRLADGREVEVSARPRKDGGFIDRSMVRLRLPGGKRGTVFRVELLKWLASMPPTEGASFTRVREALASRGLRVLPQSQDGLLVAQCPAHNDTKTSFSLREGPSSVAVHCHAGCSLQDILDGLGLKAADLLDGQVVDRDILNGAWPFSLAPSDAAMVLGWLDAQAEELRAAGECSA